MSRGVSLSMPKHIFRNALERASASRRAGRPRPSDQGRRPSAEVLEGRELLAVAIAEIPLPPGPTPGGSHPVDIVAGPDGNLWVTDSARTIDRVTIGGAITQYSIPGTGSLGALAAGADGNVWFLDNGTAGDAVNPGGTPATVKVGRITPAGVVTEFAASSSTFSRGRAITAGPDGNLWAALDDAIVRITTAGDVTAFPVENGLGADGIVAGPDGNLWFAAANTVGKITPDGAITILPTRLSGYFIGSDGIFASSDGNIYVATNTSLAGPSGNHLSRVSPDGVVTDVGGSPEISWSFAVAPDGHLWSVQSVKLGPDFVTRIAGDGIYTPPTEGAPGVIVAGPDGNLWFTEPDANRIGVVVLDAPEPGSLTAQGMPSLGATAGSSFQGSLASFTPLHTGDAASDYVARITWGDGKSSYGTIAPDGSGGFVVAGAHLYASPGNYAVSVTIIDVQLANPGATGQASTSIVAAAQLIAQPVDVTAVRGKDAPIVVARVTSPEMSGTFTATIDWGDGTTSIGELAASFPGGSSTEYVRSLTLSPGTPAVGLSVSLAHAYQRDGTYTVRVTVQDQAGWSTVVVSTLHYVSPTIYAARGFNPRARPGVPAESPFLGDFYLTAQGVAASQFAASINWGDGSAPASGLIAEIAPGVYSVRGTHAYNKVGTYTYYVTVFGFGQMFVFTGETLVSGPPLTLSGGLDPASDTGFSNRDGITMATRPHFQGTATPGTTVQLFARRDDGTSLAIGQVTTGANGLWSIVSTRLPDGRYTITASASAADGRQLPAVPVNTKGAGGRLVVDTSGPRITGVSLDPATGRIVLNFGDDLSQVNPLGLFANGAVRVTRIVPGGVGAIPARVLSLKPGGGSVTLGVGRSLASGRYLLQVAAGSVRDAAGNALDGEFRGFLPSGDRRAGGSFLAQFLTRGKASTPALPLVAEHPLAVTQSSSANRNWRRS